MFRWTKVAAVATIAVLGLAGCSGSSDPSVTEGDGTLTLGMIKQATTFEAASFQWANEAPYAQAVYDTLLRATPDGDIAAGLATEWSWDDSRTALTLTLRDDITFTDGTPFDADVAVQNLLRFRDGTGPNAGQFSGVTDVTSTDATHVVITVSAPDPALLTYLTQNGGLQESPTAFASSDIATVPVGSGPYVLNASKTVVGSSYVFTKNADYWDPEIQHYGTVVMNVYNDASSLLNAIQGGQVNAATTFDNASNDQIEAAGFTLNPQELNWAGLLLLDRDGTLSPEMADVRVRQAINLAFDREALLKTIGSGFGTVTEQIFPAGSPAFDADLDTTYPYDPEKAKSLLAEAGYPSGFTISLPRYTSLDPAIYTLMQQQLADIGITAEFTDLTGGDYISSILAAKYPAAYIQLQQDTTDWALARYTFSPDALFNPFKSSTPEMEEWLTALQTGDEAASASAAAAANEYLVDQAWFAPWYRNELNFVTDANTSVEVQAGNAYPYLWNITPKS